MDQRRRNNNSKWRVTFTLSLVVVLTIAIIALFYPKNTPLRGGGRAQLNKYVQYAVTSVDTAIFVNVTIPAFANIWGGSVNVIGYGAMCYFHAQFQVTIANDPMLKIIGSTITHGPVLGGIGWTVSPIVVVNVNRDSIHVGGYTDPSPEVKTHWVITWEGT